MLALSSFADRLPLARGLSALCAALTALLLGLGWALADLTAVTLTPSQLQVAEQKYGAPARQRLEDWLALMRDNKGKSEREKLKLANDFFNQIPWVSDPEHWSQTDYWATPTEMLVTNGGDCEDFSIAKYFTLIALGVPMDKLRITYVRARDVAPIDQAHMVLTYYPTPNAIPLVLDNLNPEILPATQRGDLTPVYSFNGEGLWLAKDRGSSQRAGSSTRLSLWTGLTARMGRELQ